MKIEGHVGRPRFRICGRDCKPGGANCNGYCNNRFVANPPEFPADTPIVAKINGQTVAIDHYEQPLVCSGCAHSAADAPFPGKPSGERPCCFCVRNVERDLWIAKAEKPIHPQHPFNGFWYDRSPAVTVPMDCYHSLGMLDQIRAWEKARETPTTLDEAKS